ncbi:MAG: hypothetical protein Q8P99_00400 [bacterium]|nr:hypothetical protein [bacterium]
MLTTLYGTDSYRRLRNLKELIDAYTAKEGNLARERFDLKEKDEFNRLKEFLNSQSIFSPKKLAILDEPFEFPETKALKELLKAHVASKDTIVLINTTKKHPAPYKFIEEEPNKFEEFKPLKGNELTRFIKKEASRLGIDLSAADISTIEGSMGADTWRIVTEIEQMALKKSKKPEGEQYSTQPDYFPSLNTLKRGRTVGERLGALERLISARRDDPARVFNGLAYQLGSVKEAQMYANYDVAVKSGKLEYDEALLAIALGLDFDPLG